PAASWAGAGGGCRAIRGHAGSWGASGTRGGGGGGRGGGGWGRCRGGPPHACDIHSVVTATLVEPRVTLPASLKRTKMRLLAGSNGIEPVAAAKIPKVGVAPAFTVVVTVLAGGARQAEGAGSVWHSERVNGKVTPPVSADAVIDAVAPTSTVATTNTPLPEDPGILTTPGVGLAANATMSGTGMSSGETDSNSVLTPVMVCV